MKLAIFDFDGTIYKKETFPLLMAHLKSTYPKAYKRFFLRILPIYAGYKIKLVPEQKMKASLMYHYTKALHRLSDTQVNQFFQKAAGKMAGDFNEQVLERIREHRKDGYYTLIVSGAFMPLLEVLNDQFHADDLIGTKLPETKADFDHVHADRKTELIHAHLNNTEISWESSYAYGDSISDRSVLELAGKPVAVCPDKELTDLALKENWEIIK